jgi:hypothetical protein
LTLLHLAGFLATGYFGFLLNTKTV